MARRVSKKKSQKTQARVAPRYVIGDSVTVEWNDACARHGWHGGERLALTPVVSCGWVVAIEADRIVLTADLDRGSGNVGRTISIPLGNVDNIKVNRNLRCSPDFYLTTDAAAKKCVV